MASALINWASLSDEDLKAFEKCVTQEKEKRSKDKEERRQNKAMNILHKLWPQIGDVNIKDCRASECQLLIVFTPSIVIPNVDEPPYYLRLDKSPREDRYSLHVDLHEYQAGSCSGMNWFNFAAKGNDSLGPHWQFKNKKQFPQELLTIPFINEIFSAPKAVFDRYSMIHEEMK